MNNNNTTMELTNGGFYTNNQTGYGVVSPFSVMDVPLLNMYGSSSTVDSTAYYADGANVVDCDFFHLPTRKRSRDSTSAYYHHQIPFSFLGQDIDISSHINQQQHEIDRFLSLHMERMKYEIEERRKKQTKTIMEAVRHGLAKRLRVKEEEKERIGKINNVLEERVKSLSIENQIWRELAQTNEATANNLRTNLEQVLSQIKDPGAAVLENVKVAGDDDAQSCCGSSLGEERGEAEKGGKQCRNCGEEESCVLLLPCRHLCLCGVCGSTVHTCPICRSPKNASVHVNMSS